MKIRGIVNERTEDAPFMGALIVANDCHKNCKGCFNQHLRKSKVYDYSAPYIIKSVKVNPFNRGIILGGLEWFEQKDDMRKLIQEALDEGLEVMVYTSYPKFIARRVLKDFRGTGIYVKTGAYKAELAVDNNYKYGIKLATSNQTIEKY